mmetsp:Transcript_9819/g.14756  ORF Transcript_9819/g.14756 Transcript_9819/m.14756 type:complete len:207 (-) Transcript_9819:1100-1720(-)
MIGKTRVSGLQKWIYAACTLSKGLRRRDMLAPILPGSSKLQEELPALILVQLLYENIQLQLVHLSSLLHGPTGNIDQDCRGPLCDLYLLLYDTILLLLYNSCKLLFLVRETNQFDIGLRRIPELLPFDTILQPLNHLVPQLLWHFRNITRGCIVLQDLLVQLLCDTIRLLCGRFVLLRGLSRNTIQDYTARGHGLAQQPSDANLQP